jgi:hypothetical protein
MMTTLQQFSDSSTIINAQFAVAFDYNSSGKQDHLVYYSPGEGAVTIIQNNHNGTFTRVFPAKISSFNPPGFGVGLVDFTFPGDRLIAFDYLGTGRLDHLLCYRPNTGDVNPGLVSILQQQSGGTFQSVFDSKQGIGGCNLASAADRIIAFDYLSNGNLDHLVCYRSGEGKVWILKNVNGTFSDVYDSNQGIGEYDLASPNDRMIAYDYGSKGHLDHLICYRPGRGAIFILENDNGTFKALPGSQGDPGNGISKFDLSQPEDRILAYDYTGTGHPDHLVCYRPGTGLIYILQNQNGTFSPVYPANFNSPPNGIGNYSLQSPDDAGFTFDYDSSGNQNYLVFYRPGDDAMPATTN